MLAFGLFTCLSHLWHIEPDILFFFSQSKQYPSNSSEHRPHVPLRSTKNSVAYIHSSYVASSLSYTVSGYISGCSSRLCWRTIAFWGTPEPMWLCCLLWPDSFSWKVSWGLEGHAHPTVFLAFKQWSFLENPRGPINRSTQLCPEEVKKPNLLTVLRYIFWDIYMNWWTIVW